MHAVTVREAKNHVLYFEVFEKQYTVRILFVWDGRRRHGPDVSARRHDLLGE